MRNPTFFVFQSTPLRSFISPIVFTLSAVCYDTATYEVLFSQQQRRHICRTSYLVRMQCTKPCEFFCCTTRTEHVTPRPTKLPFSVCLPGRLTPSCYFSSGSAHRTWEVVAPGKAHRARPILPPASFRRAHRNPFR